MFHFVMGLDKDLVYRKRHLKKYSATFIQDFQSYIIEFLQPLMH